MCLVSSVRWSDWTGKATERSSEPTQREVDGTGGDTDVACARESAREWSNELGPTTCRRRRGVCAQQGAKRTMHAQHTRRRDTRAKQQKTTAHAQTERGGPDLGPPQKNPQHKA